MMILWFHFEESGTSHSVNLHWVARITWRDGGATIVVNNFDEETTNTIEIHEPKNLLNLAEVVGNEEVLKMLKPEENDD